MKRPHIAIVGAGTAGIATAILLAKQNIEVSIFEKAKILEPVGTGLLLQPAGLAVLDHLGLLESIQQYGAVVQGLEGQLSNGDLLVNSHYKQVNPDYYGLGIHRATLCHVLKQKTEDYKKHITWHLGCEIESFVESGQGVRVLGLSLDHHFDAFFDGLIIANGARSQLRPSEWIKFDKTYPWGANWTIVPENTSLDCTILHQFYDQSKYMLGILPTGSTPDQPEKKLSSIFWSMPSSQLNNFIKNKSDFEQWLNLITQKWPNITPWFDQHKLQNQLSKPWLSANYRDVVLSKFGFGRIGVVGDAAHAMSPQLGQGANMALLDAWALSKSIEIAENNGQIDWDKVWDQYHQHRKSSTHFYQFLSRLLTPLYQSNHLWTGPLRNIAFNFMNKVPYFQKEMAITVSGLKSGFFTQMNYQEIVQITPKNNNTQMKETEYI